MVRANLVPFHDGPRPPFLFTRLTGRVAPGERVHFSESVGLLLMLPIIFAANLLWSGDCIYFELAVFRLKVPKPMSTRSSRS